MAERKPSRAGRGTVARALLGAAGALLLAAGAAFGQEADAETRLDELERKVTEQQHEIEALERARAGAPRAGETGAAGESPRIEWRWNDGFYAEGEVGGTEYVLRPRARIELDYRAFPHSQVNLASPHPIPEDQFLVRRARVGFDGSFGAFGFWLEVDPVRGGLPLGNFWVQYQQFPELEVRLGHYKTPFEIDDGLVTESFADTIERAMVVGSGTTVAPSFRPGVEVFGNLLGGVLGYWLSAQNQADSSTVTTGDPLVCARLESGIESTLRVGVAGLFTRLGGPVQNSFAGKTPGQFQWFTPVSVRGWEQAYEVDVSLHRGPFWAIAEGIWAQQERRRVLADGTDGTPLVTEGGYVTFGWKFFGPVRDAAGLQGTPFAGWQLFSMDIEKKRNAPELGLEVVARLEWCEIEDARGGRRFTSATETTVARPSTAANAARVKGNDCKAVTIGLNFNPIENVRFMADYVHLRVGDQSRAERAHSRQADELLFRAELDF